MKPEFGLAMMFLIVFVMIYCWDAYALSQGMAPERSVSQVLRTWSLAHPILPVAVGVLIGHLFW